MNDGKSLLVLGGVRSGKSRLAEHRAQASGREVVYIATATDGGDAEMRAHERRDLLQGLLAIAATQHVGDLEA